MTLKERLFLSRIGSSALPQDYDYSQFYNNVGISFSNEYITIYAIISRMLRSRDLSENERNTIEEAQEFLKTPNAIENPQEALYRISYHSTKNPYFKKIVEEIGKAAAAISFFQPVVQQANDKVNARKKLLQSVSYGDFFKFSSITRLKNNTKYIITQRTNQAAHAKHVIDLCLDANNESLPQARGASSTHPQLGIINELFGNAGSYHEKQYFCVREIIGYFSTHPISNHSLEPDAIIRSEDGSDRLVDSAKFCKFVWNSMSKELKMETIATRREDIISGCYSVFAKGIKYFKDSQELKQKIAACEKKKNQWFRFQSTKDKAEREYTSLTKQLADLSREFLRLSTGLPDIDTYTDQNLIKEADNTFSTIFIDQTMGNSLGRLDASINMLKKLTASETDPEVVEQINATIYAFQITIKSICDEAKDFKFVDKVSTILTRNDEAAERERALPYILQRIPVPPIRTTSGETLDPFRFSRRTRASAESLLSRVEETNNASTTNLPSDVCDQIDESVGMKLYAIRSNTAITLSSPKTDIERDRIQHENALATQELNSSQINHDESSLIASSLNPSTDVDADVLEVQTSPELIRRTQINNAVNEIALITQRIESSTAENNEEVANLHRVLLLDTQASATKI